VNPEQVQERLLALKRDLADRVERTHKHIHERDERVSANFAEQSVEMENQELVMSLDADGRAELKAIQAALDRLQEGTYGECIECGKPIQEQRLEAILYAALCIDCAQAREG
jgi:RNA polymerase-binding protein DksA